MAANWALPDEIKATVIGENAVAEDEQENIFGNFIKRLLHLTGDNYINQSKRILHLGKQHDKKWKKPPRHTKKKLSFKERRKLGLYSLGRKSLNYNDLLPLHSLWKDYIKKYIRCEDLHAAGECKDMSAEALGVKLYRADYHGAEFCVKRSVCPGYVGKRGIVAMETKNCFLLVGEDNVTRRIPKATSEFSFQIDKFKFSFFGKNLLSRPAERSSKKIKTVYPPYL